MKKLTFDDVCKQLKKNTGFHEISDNLSALSGAAILLLGAGSIGIRGAGGDVSVFLNALAIKDELVNISKCVLDKIIEEKTNECDKRASQIRWAYSVIYYTAFFDVLDEKMPDEMRKAIGLSINEKKSIFQDADFKTGEREDSLTETNIFFPNIVYGYQNIEGHLQKLYESMCGGLLKFVHMLSFEEISSEQTVAEFNSIVKELPQLAIDRFKNQYLYLASHFNEFYVYMQLEEEKSKGIHIEELYQNIISIGCNNTEKIDVGLEHLEKVLLDLPEIIHEEKVKNIRNAMIEKYKREIDKPIIDSKNNDEKLKYPSIQKAFIPQSYKLLEYTGAEKLEEKETWSEQKECNDMDSFWMRYYVSHHSLENLLLILGEPGGGKSLLTKIISARMSDDNNITVRIPLREVSVDKEIEDIVCEQIQKDGDAAERLPTYKWFAEHFKFNPITLIFDGYDEVLQATGGVYRNLLNKILKFQEQCAERHRPVRVVVTSRETLIDKADIPVGTVVLKLLEFNEIQREEWIEIWNHYNEALFQKEHISPFMLPENNNSIDELSRQPLLLLMLAIYDANLEEGINSLGQEENLNRTKLYDQLLRRFFRRELRKGPRGEEVSYEDSAEKEKETMIDQEMEKLGIAALGMFIRGKLSLKVSEMESDLKYMGSRTPNYKSVGKMLSNAEEFFGSFFFIHDSRTGNKEAEDREVAFEFLHKTFYEFLVADLVLKYLIKAIDELDAMKNSKRSDGYQKMLDNPDNFDKQYYTAFMNAYLCAEPEIIEMLAEWKESAIEDRFQGERSDYDIIIEEVFDRQMEMLCNNIYMPSIWRECSRDNVAPKSYMQYCATYFMNLLILQVTTKKDSKRIIPKKDWRYIAQFWKMNVQEDVLLKFTSLFSITEQSNGVRIEKKHVSDNVERKNLLERQMDIFNFLQDDISYYLYSLHDVEIPYRQKQSLRRALTRKGINITFELFIGALNEYIFESDSQHSIEKNIARGIRIISRSKVDASIVLEWLLYINHCLDSEICSVRRHRSMADDLMDVVLDKYSGNVQLLSEAFRCCRRIGGIDIFVQKRQYLYGKFEKIIYDNLHLADEYLDLAEKFMTIQEMGVIAGKLIDMLSTSPFYSLDKEIKVLTKLYMCGFEVKANDLLHNIIANTDKLYNSSPRAMLNLLRLCLLLDRTGDVYSLVRIGAHEFEKFFYDQPEAAVTFLEAVPVIAETRQYVEGMMSCVVRHLGPVLFDNPKLVIKAMKTAARLDNSEYYKELVRLAYRRYDIIFDFEPGEAIHFLRTVTRNLKKGEFKDAIEYSIRRFNYLLVTSTEAAVDLLILSKGSVANRSFYMQRYFDYILFHHSSVDSGKVYELFSGMGKRESNEMAEFFRKRYSYIISNFPDLWEILKTIWPDLMIVQ